jgi:dihydrofolate reductase
MDVPMVVVTHRVPEEWVDIEVARGIAGEKDVVVGAPSVTQQCLHLGLLDAINIDLVPVLLGSGVRLRDQLPNPIELVVTEASGKPHVTHLNYRVITDDGGTR